MVRKVKLFFKKLGGEIKMITTALIVFTVLSIVIGGTCMAKLSKF